MKYKVLDTLKALTTQGEIVLLPGQIITLPHDKAITLLNENKITPAEQVAYRVYSEILQTHLWVVETDKDMHSLRSQGVTEAIYTQKEISEIKKLPKESLGDIHQVKATFPESTIQKTKKRHTNERQGGQ